jgi:hypothetical protein
MQKIRIKEHAQVPEIIEWLEDTVGPIIDVTKQYDEIVSANGEGWSVVKTTISHPASDRVLKELGFPEPNKVSTEFRNNLYPKALVFYVSFDDDSYAVQFKLSYD